MRPLQLTIEGLKSVAEPQTINFEKLSENGVFGIFGRTGSGKSTILDAIVLALYGDIVAGKANKDFVNVDCMQTRVYLVFSISSGENKGKYSIERVYKFNKARTDLTQSVAKLWKTDGDKEICLADNNRELNDKIQNEIIGLKKEDFLKCIALPQGEFSAFVKMARDEFSAVSEQLAALKAKNLADNEHVKELKDALEKAKAGYAGVLSELKIDEQTALNILDGQKTIEEKRLKVSEFDENMSFLTKKAAETEKKLEELKEFSAADEILSEYAIIEDKLEKNNIYYNKMRADYENGLKKSDEWCIMTKESDKTESALTLYGRLADLVRAGRFMEFIADEYLHEVAADAEKRVLELTSGKYGLVYDGEFAVTDNLHGGIRRPASGLSGGETFLVSLSLALALASEISRKALKPVDFFFLDEGFGTLDDELIDTVTDSLEKLRRENLTVGLITHVGELKNRISSSLNVIGANAEHGTRFIED